MNPHWTAAGAGWINADQQDELFESKAAGAATPGF